MAFDPKNPIDATDAELLRQAAGAEPGERGAAIGESYRRHGAAVHRFAWLLTGSDATADVLQETFFVLFVSPAGFDPMRGSAAAFACGIARRHALRGRQTRVEAVDDPHRFDLPSQPPLPSDEAERAAAIERLYAAVRTLPRHFRDVLVLVELQEFSYADTAAIVGIEIGTVRSRLSRAKARPLELLAAPDAIQR